MACKKELSFEEAVAELEAAVDRLEGGELSLDASLLEFEKAVGLVKICTEKLENAKAKVRILTEGKDGCITDKPFIQENDEN